MRKWLHISMHPFLLWILTSVSEGRSSHGLVQAKHLEKSVVFGNHAHQLWVCLQGSSFGQPLLSVHLGWQSDGGGEGQSRPLTSPQCTLSHSYSWSCNSKHLWHLPSSTAVTAPTAHLSWCWVVASLCCDIVTFHLQKWQNLKSVDGSLFCYGFNPSALVYSALFSIPVRMIT